ncbi:MAG: hypothetical protein ACE5K0_04935 [Candidatus Methanofastidiosia archaeon]
MSDEKIEPQKRTQTVFVLIKTRTGDENKIMQKLISFKESAEVHLVPGEYDILLELHFKIQLFENPVRGAFKFIMEEIGSIPEVRDTYTLVCGESLIKRTGIHEFE